DYLKLGFDHIWSGLDHLLFVAGLMILAGSIRRVLVAVTGFTIAHSITLSLSALGLIHVPIPPVEAMIALSILFLAREIARPTPDGLARRFPILVSSSFGLLHGLGFAAALREIGLPRTETAVGLLFFNVGVEIGQILFIGAASASFLALRAALRALPPIPLPRAIETTTLAGYALGIPAAWWFLSRVAAFG
ncbi:MAG: HupE/UreJ family protein, partial [Sphingomonadales bacterium]